MFPSIHLGFADIPTYSTIFLAGFFIAIVIARKIAGTRFGKRRSSSSCSLAMQTFLLGVQKGDILFREREYPPFTRSPRGRGGENHFF